MIAVMDSSFSAIELLRDAGRHLCLISRLRLDAGLYAPAPPRKPGTRGRPRVKGARQPSLKERLANPATRWQRVSLNGWYGRTEQRLHIASGTALWHHPGMRVPIRWVLVRDPSGEKEPQAFLCTDLDADPVDVLRWFVRRWRVETTFEEARRHLGLETQRQWSDLAILRTTPALLGLFSLVTLWATQLEAAQRFLPECVRWYPKQAPPSAMPWPSSAVNSGPRRFSQAHRITQTPRNSQPTCSTACCSSPVGRPNLQSQATRLCRIILNSGKSDSGARRSTQR